MTEDEREVQIAITKFDVDAWSLRQRDWEYDSTVKDEKSRRVSKQMPWITAWAFIPRTEEQKGTVSFHTHDWTKRHRRV